MGLQFRLYGLGHIGFQACTGSVFKDPRVVGPIRPSLLRDTSRPLPDSACELY